VTSSSASPPERVAVVGLGYVGLPLAVAFARTHRAGDIVGYDIDAKRIAELTRGHDRNGQLGADVLGVAGLALSADPAVLSGVDIHIVTAPTPVDEAKQPDLSAVLAASRTVGRALKPGAIVVYESTVYPGVTEQVCGPALEAASGLVRGRDFFLGYSPERINVGDPEHGLDRIVKVVAGETPAVAERLARLYGGVTSAGVFIARDIRTAEAAKVIENAQRDLNIAFVNEVAMIFGRMGLSVHDVLDTAATKWNFLRFAPGLVGGHCIGVDPFYLAHAASAAGHHPEIILAGRRINDSMGDYVAGQVSERLNRGDPVLLLGLTFKENVPDLRNSKVVDVVRGLERRGHQVHVHDPLADPDEARAFYDIELLPALEAAGPVAAVVGAVAHAPYRALDGTALTRLLRPGGLVADVKGMWRGGALPAAIRYWGL
jgi:UDP-N-acetyl-D-galactosamine dehydrogenase